MAVLGSGIQPCEINNNANFPAGNRPLVLWLLVLAAMVAAMVLLGGLTRLTGSGLSMVEWNPGTLLPPLGRHAWEAAFAEYRTSPQFRLVNAGMDLDGFRAIFWLEYLHRLWGRLVGVVLLLPLAGFWARGMIDRTLARRLLLLFALGGLQGGLGWLMVASGLIDRPEVSHFRLAAHLLLGVLIFGALLWSALDGARGPVRLRWRGPVPAVLALLLVTMTWGAFVAGLKAGLVYETFPLMDGHLLPAGTPDVLHDLGWVQATHRLLALSTVLAVAGLWLARHRLPPAARRPLGLAAGWAWVQAALGVSTLLLGVPVPLAAAHQMGALVLFALLLWTCHACIGEPRT